LLESLAKLGSIVYSFRRRQNRAMLMTIYTQTFLVEAAKVASWPSCRHSLGNGRRPDQALALSGRCAR
jgi:hypothetical protein